MMKFCIVLILAFATTSFVSASPLCGCPSAMFKSHDGGKTIATIVKSLAKLTPEVQIQSCTSSICEQFCDKIRKRIGKYPAFNLTLGLRSHPTIGDAICRYMNQTVVDLYEGYFSQLSGDCKGQMKYTGLHSEEMLCCGPAPMRYYIPCR